VTAAPANRPPAFAKPTARQAVLRARARRVIWCGVEHADRYRGFVVPKKGLNDRSQAIYCLESVQKGTRPGGTVRAPRPDVFTAQGQRTFLSIQSHRPYGTDSRLNLFQAINCLATINRSLRDENLSTSVHKLGVSTIYSNPSFLLCIRGRRVLFYSRFNFSNARQPPPGISRLSSNPPSRDDPSRGC
jgi:hypothetical protein